MDKIVIFVVLGLLLVSGAAAILMLLGYPIIYSAEKCGVENCHGLDVKCGSNVPQACTEIYMAGDRCRQYASCKIVSGKCSLVAGKEFSDCKTCVETCMEKNDSIEIFSCESRC
jgi:hypothetical protein